MSDKKRSFFNRTVKERRKWLIIATPIVLSVLLLLSLTGRNGDPEYRTEPARRGDITAAVTATGTVNAVTTILIGTQVSGTISNLYVDFNSKVKKGQVIAQIDPAAFEAQARQARANLSAAEANREKAKAALADAKRTLDRNRLLLDKNLIPRSDLDTATTNHDAGKAQVSAAAAQVEQARAALALAETNLKYTRIVSPVDGVVISRDVDVGQTVAASFQTPTLFTIAQDLTKMQVDTNVAESDIGSVKVGQEAEFIVDAYPDRAFKGKVRQIRRAPINVQNVVTYIVVLQVENPDMKLMPGMTANVSIITAMKRGVLRIPNRALRFRPSDAVSGKDPAGSDRGPGIWVLENGRPRRVGVTPGISDGIVTEVVSGELKDGQNIIIDSVKKNKQERRSRRLRMF